MIKHKCGEGEIYHCVLTGLIGILQRSGAPSQVPQTHPYLSFETEDLPNDEKVAYLVKMERLKKRNIEIGLVIDLTFIEEIGFSQTLSDLLRREFRDSEGIPRVFRGLLATLGRKR